LAREAARGVIVDVHPPRSGWQRSVPGPVWTPAGERGKLVCVVTDETAGRGLAAWAGEDHVCGSCCLAYAQVTLDDAVRAIQALPVRLRAAVDGVPSRIRRQRPGPSAWSVAEYACHIRDVLISTTIRLHRGRTESSPAVDPMFNDLRAKLFGYNQADLAAVLEETAAAVAGLCQEISRMNGPDWDRVVLRRPGEQRTTRWLVRQAMHEGLHHLADIAAVHASLTYRPGASFPRRQGHADEENYRT